MFFRSVISALMILIQLTVMNVGFGLKGTDGTAEEPPSEIVNDISSDEMADTIKYAADCYNTVQGCYENGGYDRYTLENSGAKVVAELNTRGKKSLSVYDKDGNPYYEHSGYVYYIDSDSKKYVSNESESQSRVNTTKLGGYYYEAHIRDLDFKNANNRDFKADITMHVFPDKIHQQYFLYAKEATTNLREFGTEIKIPQRTVASVKVSDEENSGSLPYKSSTCSYVAFDIIGTGIVGFIIPNDGSTASVSVSLENGNYVFRQTAAYDGCGINKYDEAGGYSLNYLTFGNRLYTDSSHNFDGIESAARQEHAQLDGITVEKNSDGAKYRGYEKLRGTYLFSISGTDFNKAYYNKPDKHYKAPVTIKNDGEERNIWIRFNYVQGFLEGAALLNKYNSLLPVEVQVSKNFCGDKGEDFYSNKDTAYSNSIFPIALKNGKDAEFTLINAYQNWGKSPLKQLSSIEFHVSYYHLSTGVTETNCIAPYSVYNDGWILPDFRTRSGTMWADQPQFNSTGKLYFSNYNTTPLSNIQSTYKKSEIVSDGFSYSDILMDFEDGNDAYHFTCRHVEMPQTDENRTYYTLNLVFDRDTTFKNFKRDFSLFTFKSRFYSYDKLNYLDENGETQIVEINKKPSFAKYYRLSPDGGYLGYMDVEDYENNSQINNVFLTNFALIVKNSEVIRNGKTEDVACVFKDKYSKSDNINIGALTLDYNNVSFKAGDIIKIDFILLPWGNGNETTDENVQRVREDSVLNSARVTDGNSLDDTYIPTVEASDNYSEFTVKGGRNNIAVRVNGFTSYQKPNIFVWENGEWIGFDSSSVNGYDGYTVFYNKNTGLYDFSFVYTSTDPDREYRFKIEQ